MPIYINGKPLTLHYRMDRGVWVGCFGQGWYVGTDVHALLAQVIKAV